MERSSDIKGRSPQLSHESHPALHSSCLFNSFTKIANMCIPCCWPFTDVWLEEPPKKKEEKKEDLQYIYVHDDAVWYPVRENFSSFTLSSSFNLPPTSHDPSHTAEKITPLHLLLTVIVSSQSSLIKSAMSLFTYIPSAPEPPPVAETPADSYYLYDPVNAGRLREADNNFYYTPVSVARAPNIPKQYLHRHVHVPTPQVSYVQYPAYTSVYVLILFGTFFSIRMLTFDLDLRDQTGSLPAASTVLLLGTFFRTTCKCYVVWFN